MGLRLIILLGIGLVALAAIGILIYFLLGKRDE